MFDISFIFIIGLVMFLACFLQSITGFGFTLVVLPFLLFFKNISPIEAIAITVVCSNFQRLISLKKLYKHINWKECRFVMAIGLLGLLIGLWLLYLFYDIDKSVFKQIIGLLILIFLTIRWFARIKPTEPFKKWWGCLASFSSGILNGFANIGGPPIILWILSHCWHQEKMRATTIAFITFFAPFQITLLLIIFGQDMLITFLKSFIFLPFVFLGSWFGLLAGARLNGVIIRTMMYVVLVIICFSLILGSFFKG